MQTYLRWVILCRVFIVYIEILCSENHKWKINKVAVFLWVYTRRNGKSFLAVSFQRYRELYVFIYVMYLVIKYYMDSRKFHL